MSKPIKSLTKEQAATEIQNVIDQLKLNKVERDHLENCLKTLAEEKAKKE